MASRFLLTALLANGLLLAGVIQHEIVVALVKFSATDYAEYIAEEGYVVLYCREFDMLATEVKDSSLLESTIIDENASLGSSEHSQGNYYQENRSYWGHHTTKAKVPMNEEKRWEHNLYEAFLWGSLFGPLIGCLSVHYFGPKRTIEGGLLGASLATLLVPAAWLTVAHFVLCAVQGVCTSMIWPAVQVLASRWYCPAERSTYLSCYASWTAGWAVAVFLSAILTESMGRDSVFYITSLLIVCWYVAWQKYVTDPPSIPPNTSWTERSLINIISEDYAPGIHSTNYQGNGLPLKAFVLSGPLWACGIACFGSQWGLTTLLLAATKYLQIVYGFSLSYDETLSYLPSLGHLLCAVTFGFLADHYTAESIVSTTTVRKILVYISHFLPGAIIFVIGYTGCDPSAPAALFSAALGLNGATPAGVYTSSLEISPKFSGAIIGFVQTIGAAGALSASYFVKEGLYGSLPGTWCLVFGMCSTVLVISATIFLIFGSGTEQQWSKSSIDVSLLTIGQPSCSETNYQQHELQQSSALEEIEQANLKNQVFSV